MGLAGTDLAGGATTVGQSQLAPIFSQFIEDGVEAAEFFLLQGALLIAEFAVGEGVGSGCAAGAIGVDRLVESLQQIAAGDPTGGAGAAVLLPFIGDAGVFLIPTVIV